MSTPRASTLRLLDRVTDLPAVLVDAKGDVLAWNGLATALLGDFSAWPAGQRNLTWQRFLGDGGRVAAGGEEGERTAVETVASLRLVAARYPDDPGLRPRRWRCCGSSASRTWGRRRSGVFRGACRGRAAGSDSGVCAVRRGWRTSREERP